MNRRLPPLHALRAFEAAARHLSFTRAATELFVTQGAVSRQVKALEDDIGQPLFRRLPRGLELTAAGRSLLGATSEAFDALARAATRLRANANEIRLKVPPTFGVRWLVPRLTRLHLAQRELRVQVTTTWRHDIDFEREEYDAGIQLGRGDWPGLAADLLQIEHLVPVCARALAEGEPPLLVPADLVRHSLLHPTPDHEDWRIWLAAYPVDGVDPEGGQDFVTMEMAIAAAAAGYGVAIGAYELIREDLAAGRLVLPFGPRLAEGGGYYLVYPEERRREARFERFRAWLLAEAAADRAALRD